MAKKAKTSKKAPKKTSRSVSKAKASKHAKAPKKAKAAKSPKAKKAAKKGFVPPYKCQKTLEKGVCLKYLYNPNSKAYDLGGDRVPCSSCEYCM